MSCLFFTQEFKLEGGGQFQSSFRAVSKLWTPTISQNWNWDSFRAVPVRFRSNRCPIYYLLGNSNWGSFRIVPEQFRSTEYPPFYRTEVGPVSEQFQCDFGALDILFILYSEIQIGVVSEHFQSSFRAVLEYWIPTILPNWNQGSFRAVFFQVSNNSESKFLNSYQFKTGLLQFEHLNWLAWLISHITTEMGTHPESFQCSFGAVGGQ